jgi:hypothetical protein
VPPGSRYIESEANYTHLPHAVLYWSLFWLGRKEEARRHWEAARELAPESKRYRRDARLFGLPVDQPGEEEPAGLTLEDDELTEGL